MDCMGQLFGSFDIKLLSTSLLIMENYSNVSQNKTYSTYTSNIGLPKIPSMEFCIGIFTKIQKNKWTGNFWESSEHLLIVYHIIRQLQKSYWMFPDIQPSMLLEIMGLCSDCRTIRSFIDCLNSPTYSISKLLTLSILNSLLPGSMSDYMSMDAENFKILTFLCRDFRHFGSQDSNLFFSDYSNFSDMEEKSSLTYHTSPVSQNEISKLQNKFCHYCLKLWEKLVIEGTDLTFFWKNGCIDCIPSLIVENCSTRQQALKTLATFVLFSTDKRQVANIQSLLEPYSLSLISCDSLEESLDAVLYSVIIFYGNGDVAKFPQLHCQIIKFIEVHSISQNHGFLDLVESSLWFDNLIEFFTENLDIPVFSIIPLRLAAQSPRALSRLHENLKSSPRTILALEKASAMGCGAVNHSVSKLFRVLNRIFVTPLPRNVMDWDVLDLKKWLSVIGFPLSHFIDFRKHSQWFFNEILICGQISDILKVLKLDMRFPCQFNRFRQEVEFLRKWASLLVRKIAENCDSKSFESKRYTRLSFSEEDRISTDFHTLPVDEKSWSNRSWSFKNGECSRRILFFDKAHVRKVFTSTPKEPQYFDVFISYRRDYGSHIASLLHCIFKVRGIKSFLDVTTLSSGCFESSLVESIAKSKNFIAILSRNALDRCYEDEQVEDYFHLEIRTAMERDKNVIPIFLDFNTPDVTRLPKVFGSFLTRNGVTWNHEYQDACIDKVISFLLPLTDCEILTTPLSISSI